MISIQFLNYFLKICETRSMNKAAEQLYISQPALSLAMKKLENELHVVLFERSNHGVEITEAGERLLNHGKMIMQQFDLIDNLSGKREEKQLTVSAFPFLIYPQTISRLVMLPEYKSSQIVFYECRLQNILENVDTAVSEIGVIQFNNKQVAAVKRKLRNMDLEFTSISVNDWAVALGPKNPLYACKGVTMEQLKSYRHIRLWDDYFSLLFGEIRLNDTFIKDYQTNFINSSSIILHLLQTTNMYMFCSTQKGIFGSNSLIRNIPITDSDIKINVGWVRKKTHQISGIAHDFLRLLTEEYSVKESRGQP